MMNSYRMLLGLKNKNVIYDALELVGLKDSVSALMGTLSGGQSQKALFARALLGNPELLILTSLHRFRPGKSVRNLQIYKRA